MARSVSTPDEELYRRTDEVLHYLWDPIGVAGIPEARDEYYGYLPQVFNLLKANAGADEIANYLFEVATRSMGLGGSRDRDLQTAEILLEWKAALLEA
jgi:hypothetical protein